MADLVCDSLPMINPGPGREDELVFAAWEEELRSVNSGAGKTLLISEGCEPFAAAAVSPRVVSVVFDGDCLPLFAMPDGVSAVFCAGSAKTLRAARYFAEIRGVPCTLFPENAALDGAFERRGEVLLGGKDLPVPLRPGRVVCDMDRLAPSLAEARARLLLSRLSGFEGRALCAFGFRVGFEELPPFSGTEREIVEENAARRKREREGAYPGEGVVLAQILGESGYDYPAWRAYLELTSLYAAFFEKGMPRRYLLPDYRARAERAGVPLPRIPTAEEYALRAIALERMRAPFTREARAILRGREKERLALAALAGETIPETGELSLLDRLPERAPEGLTAIIRDFGLMEWTHDKG